MGFLNTDCPRCGSETAFHNGVCHECPECDYEWSCIDGEEVDDEETES